ncbi:MAG: hypothetical protein ABSG69_18730, partial [Candidatus Acidiferrum sp.]
KAGHSLHTQLVSQLLADPSRWTITTEAASSAPYHPAEDGLGRHGETRTLAKKSTDLPAELSVPTDVTASAAD